MNLQLKNKASLLDKQNSYLLQLALILFPCHSVSGPYITFALLKNAKKVTRVMQAKEISNPLIIFLDQLSEKSLIGRLAIGQIQWRIQTFR